MAWQPLSLLALLFVTGTISSPVQDAPLKNHLATTLMKELGKSEKNVIFSPVSLKSALGIVALGAKGPTEHELFTSLGYSPDSARTSITEEQKSLNEKPAPGAIWQTANRIMVAPDVPIKKEYITEVNQIFPGVAVDNFNFEEPAKTAAEVNSWVSDKTNKVIQKLLDESSVNPETRMIVLNAVYFKGEWKHGFDKKKTKKECFFSEPGKCTETDMMHLKEDFKYGYHDEMKAQIIEFPYKNEDFSMIVVLPDQKHGNLTTLLSKLNVDEVINFIDGKNWPVEVHVTLPKFEIEFEQEMKTPLMNIGIKNVFSDASDLSGMISGLRAKVDSVIHKAKITCDEEGTVAAAATGVQFVIESASIPEIFTANRPFLILLRSVKSGVFFAGLKKNF